MDLYTPELHELVQTKCERLIKYFNYCTVKGQDEDDVVNPFSFFTYELWHPYTGDFRLGEYIEMNKAQKKWVLSDPEINKLDANAKKLFPEEKHVGRWFTLNLGFKVMKLNKVLTMTKRKPGEKKGE